MENDSKPNRSRLKPWLRFAAGLFVLSLFYCFFASGYVPPGVFGDVLRHNRCNNIDATPLFYTEVENMSELEEALSKMREKADEKHLDANKPESDSLTINQNINGNWRPDG